MGVTSYSYFFVYHVTFVDGKKDIINVHSVFNDKGVIIKFRGKNITNYITESNVDTDTIGIYTIKYIVGKKVFEKDVEVVDNESPSLELEQDKVVVNYNGKYKEPGYTATDNYDGDITNKVSIKNKVNYNKKGIYKIEYSVSDSFNNETIINRTINVQEKNTKGIPVLMYHWFYDDTIGEKAGTPNSHNYISKTEIEKQVKYLKESDFYFPTWQELIDYIDGKIDLPEKSVVITDDDCVESFFRVAYPIFEKYEVPVTSFCVSSKNIWKKYKNKEYLRFESHTDNLHDYTCDSYWGGAAMCSSYKKIYNDIKTSIEKLKSSYALAYPYGQYSDDFIEALKANDVKLAFTTADGRVHVGSNKYLLPRVRISSWTIIDTYKTLVN